MTIVTGHEPWHWHDVNGIHRMTDPRTIEGYSPAFYDADERAYVTHLETHEGELSDPQRSAYDSPALVTLFELLEARQKEVETIKELIASRRELDQFLKN